MNGVYKFLVNRPVTTGDCVMFDIDDTLICSGDGSLNQPVYDLLMFSRSLGYKVIIMTARPYILGVQGYTMNQLDQFNIKYDLLVMCSPSDKSKFKKVLQKERGYNFALSVGDQMTDLTDSEANLKIEPCYV